MSESFRTPPREPWTPAGAPGNGYQSTAPQPPKEHAGNEPEPEVGRVLLVGLLGGLLSAAGYMVYRRLPDEQKDRLNSQVRTLVQQRINEIRQNFNF